MIDRVYPKPHRQEDPLCRCPQDQYPHRRCLVHRQLTIRDKEQSPAHRAYLVTQVLLGNPMAVCQVCNLPIRRHSTGNYFHLMGVEGRHEAVPKL